MPDDPAALDRLVATAMAGDGADAVRRWAASGAMALTGHPGRPADAGPARVALALDALAADIARSSARVGEAVRLDGAALLGERAAIAGFTRAGPVSCGGATRLLRARDGAVVALSLARDDDWSLLPALFALCGHELDDAVLDGADGAPATGAAWTVVERNVGGLDAGLVVGAAAELGLAAALLGEVPANRPLVGVRPSAATAGAPAHRTPLVVDLSSLWAGPLCAHVLGLAGAQVVKVESASRPDGARSGPPAFFDLLHAGHDTVAVDFGSNEGREALRSLIRRAEVVIEASRPRALAALGLSFEDLDRQGWRGVWVSITGHGRSGDAAHRIAFGDDAAVAGGLVAGERHTPVFCADAVADPATGLLAAAASLRALAAGWSGLLEVSLAGTAAHLAAGLHADPDVTLPTGLEVCSPRARSPRGRAASLGAHTARWVP